MKKRILGVVSLVLIAICLCGSVSAAVIEPVRPLWDNVDAVYCNITFSGTNGRVICDIEAVSGTTSIEGTLTLYEDGDEIDSWDIDVNTSYVNIVETFTGTRGSTYELVLDVEVMVDGLAETLERSVTKKC